MNALDTKAHGVHFALLVFRFDIGLLLLSLNSSGLAVHSFKIGYNGLKHCSIIKVPNPCLRVAEVSGGFYSSIMLNSFFPFPIICSPHTVVETAQATHKKALTLV